MAPPGPRPAALMAALGLLVLTPPRPALVVTSPRGPAPSASGPAPAEAPPFRNLRVDPALLRLSWDRERPGPRAACRKEGRGPQWADAGAERCTLRSLSLCHPTALTVFLRGVPGSAASIRFPDPDSTPPPPARGLRCSVHDVVRLTCRWDPGPGAGPRPHFRMHFRPASANRSADRECPRYLGPGDGVITEGRGPGDDVTGDAVTTRLGCRLDDVTALPPLLTVTVTAAGAPGCSDAAVDLPGAEVLAPPTLAAACNGSHEALLRWEVRSLFHKGFEFELQINKSSRSEPEVVKTPQRHHRVRNPGSASFRVRAWAEDDAVDASGWSAAAMLDCRPRPRGAVTTALTGGLAGLGAGLALLTSLLLLWRRPLGRSLWPPIPRLKNPMGAEPGETVPWPAAPEDCKVTHVTEA